MTLENCKRLLAHYEKAKEDPELSTRARHNMTVAAAEMKARVAKKEGMLPKPVEVKPVGEKPKG